jgi:hypothetical protein
MLPRCTLNFGATASCRQASAEQEQDALQRLRAMPTRTVFAAKKAGYADADDEALFLTRLAVALLVH